MQAAVAAREGGFLVGNYQLLPALAPEEYQTLKADIAKRGVLVPVEYDDDGNILDGYHRVQICQELGITEWPRIVRAGLAEAEKRAHARRLNLNRRHLSQEQRRELIAEQLRETPERSDRQIAKQLGIHNETVGTQRVAMVARGELTESVSSQGADGKWYPRVVEREASRELVGHDYSKTAPLPARTNGLAVHFSSDSAEWYTPPEIIQRVLRIFGEIDTDPCSNSGDHPNVPATRRFTQSDDGLSQVWRGRVYMNPPYGRVIGDWVSKLLSEYEAGHTTAAVALVPARTDTDWFRQFRDYAICFIDGRLKFSGMANSAPFPSAVVYLGKDAGAFARVFADMGDVWVRFKS